MSFANIYRKEFKWNLRSFIIWTTIFVAFALMYIPLTDQILQQSEAMLKFIEKMPKLLLQIFSFEPELLTKPEGLFGSEGMSFVYILSAVFSSMLAGSMFSKEFEQKTIEYLLVKPCSRLTVFLSKLSVMFSFILILAGTFTFFEIRLFDAFVTQEYSVRILYAFGLYALTVQVFFAALATMISVIVQKSSLNTSISIGLIIFMYFGDSLGRSFENLEWMSIISIFRYIPLIDTIKNNQIMLGNSLIIILISGVFLLAGGLIFSRTDIKL
ncbi:hypothetical protein AT15_03935 [Kosmotoga arenicorallina S304]|uniref:ABC transporter permease n=1 Tax=Kosmotoga arenicorallina S304 TaxID=1453497 RepID=A0A176JYX0_9BACT|nr:ABC transporter permease subunit [Kosmotoga arenicorallina]OAA29149.1 hypothetical protein AT15_03935 [Kosmotoga arenicorallina S304]